MATNTIALTMCSSPECKNDANALCLHCDKHVCTKHYLEHVKLTNDELLPLADQLNTIINTLQEINVTHISQLAMEQLEQWRIESHQRIDELYDDKRKTLTKLSELKLEEESMISKKLNTLVQQYTDQLDASFQQVEKIKKDITALETRCSNLKKTGFFHFENKPLELIYHSLVIKAKQFSYFTGGGSLLRLEYQILLNEWIGIKGQHWRLIYKAKRDGFKAEDFHRCSDNQGPTLTIIQSKENEYLFGGYTSQGWTSSGNYAEDKNNPFLFTLINPHNILPTRYTIKLESIEDAMVHSSIYGPTFGGGFDLHICNESDIVPGSYSNFPVSYIDTTGKGMLTFTGSNQFQTSDIEIYRLVS
ncbi:unnamed protein product [Adineta steineri]|uniref:TLDc domain-containing protein n=1 Tax=Adineta steineri TaxID=433720 RepID=A0A818G6D8_9BILA|nr:unnamed protein product [Adineta steineri]